MSADEELFDQLYSEMAKSVKDNKSGIVAKPGDIKLASFVPYGIPSGIPQLDLSISRPGLPVGKIIEFYGFEASGKTTAAYAAMAQCQRMGGGCFFIDTESSFDPKRAAACGVNPDKNLLLGEAKTIEGVFTQIDGMLDKLQKVNWKKPFLIVVDSITAAETEHESTKDLDAEAKVGDEAKAIRRGVRRIWQRVAALKVPVIFINHAIAKIGGSGWGKKSQAAGGHSLKFAAALRCEFAHISNVNKGDAEDKERVGAKIKITVEKLKGGTLRLPSFEAYLSNDRGFDFASSMLDALEHIDAVTKNGRGYYDLGDGRNLTKNEFMEELYAQAGGVAEEYKRFYQICIDKGYMTPYESAMEA